MAQTQPSGESFKARLVLDEPDRPVQLVLTAQQAADLAFIVEDFAREVVPNCEEVERLVQFSAMLAGRLEDLVTARAMMFGRKPRNDLARAG